MKLNRKKTEALEYFLFCSTCNTPTVKLSSLKKNDEVSMGVKLKCEKCKAEDAFTIKIQDFLCWVATPEVAEARRILESEQISLW